MTSAPARLADPPPAPPLVDLDREGEIVTDHARRCLWRILGRARSGAYVAVECHRGGAPRCRRVPVELPPELATPRRWGLPPELAPAPAELDPGWFGALVDLPAPARPVPDPMGRATHADLVDLPGREIFAPDTDPVVDTAPLLIRRSLSHPVGCVWTRDGAVRADGHELYGWTIGGPRVRARADAWDAWCRLVNTPHYGDVAYLIRPVGPVQGGAEARAPGDARALPETRFTAGCVLVSGSVVDLGRELVARGLLGIGPGTPPLLRAWLDQRAAWLRPMARERVSRVFETIEAIAAAPLPPRAPLDPSPGFEADAVLVRRLEAVREEHAWLSSLTGADPFGP